MAFHTSKWLWNTKSLYIPEWFYLCRIIYILSYGMGSPTRRVCNDMSWYAVYSLCGAWWLRSSAEHPCSNSSPRFRSFIYSVANLPVNVCFVSETIE